MFENVLSQETIKLVNSLSLKAADFYLAGGTGLALQLGHRKSEDLDFFAAEYFNTEIILEQIHPERIFLVKEGTIHCEMKKVKISFLYYKQPLIYPVILWYGVKIADWRDITAEKIKTISQRGAKKDFYDLYAILQKKISIEEACKLFKTRFASSGINFYHVVKSLVFFEDADAEPPPTLIEKNSVWEWKTVKKYFENNIKRFQEELM